MKKILTAVLSLSGIKAFGEVTVLIDHMQKNPSNNAGAQLISSTYRSKLSTKLTPALKESTKAALGDGLVFNVLSAERYYGNISDAAG